MMGFLRIGSLLWLLGALAACGGSSDGAPAPPTNVSFASQVAPIFAASCNYCHHTGNGSGLDLTKPFDPATGLLGHANSWTSARAKLIVDPGNVANSALIDKVERTDLDPHTEGNRMPWNNELLTPSEIAAVRQWITDGAKDDAFFADNVATTFGDGTSLGTAGGKCGYCHYPGTPQPPDLTHPFDPQTGVVNVTGTAGSGKQMTPGDPGASLLMKKVDPSLDSPTGPRMPMQIAPLAQTSIDILKAWVLEGAKNN